MLKIRSLTQLSLIIPILATSVSCDDSKARELALAKAEAEEARQAADQAATALAKAEAATARKAAEAAEAAATLARVEAAQRARREEKNSLQANPNHFLLTRDWGYFNKGIINSYRQLTTLTLENTSRFGVRDLSGEVDWFDSGGMKIGSTTFALKGSIAGKDQRRFSVESGTMSSSTIQADAANAKIRFTNLTVMDTD